MVKTVVSSRKKKKKKMCASEKEETYVNPPKLLNTSKSNNLLQQLIPIRTFPRWGLGVPQSPLMHQRMLNVEVLRVMEDGDLLVPRISRGGGGSGDGLGGLVLVGDWGFGCGGHGW